MLPYFVNVVVEDAFHAGLVWTDENMKGLSAVDTMGYPVAFVKIGYSLPDAVTFLPDIKPRPPNSSSVCTEKRYPSMLEEAYSNILPAKGYRTEGRPAPRPSSSQYKAALAAPAGSC